MQVHNQGGCKSCHPNATIFRHLTKDELKYISENRNEVRFNAGEIISKQGTSLTHIICISSGMGKVYLEGSHKKNLILRLIKPPDTVAGAGMFSDKLLHFSVGALVDLTACLIKVEAINRVVEQNTMFAFDLFNHIHSREIKKYELLINLTQKQMPGRIADVILYLSRDIYNHDSFEALISRQDLADMSAMSKESAIRILKEFKDEKIVHVDGNNFEILDMEALKKISEKG